MGRRARSVVVMKNVGMSLRSQGSSGHGQGRLRDPCHAGAAAFIEGERAAGDGTGSGTAALLRRERTPSVASQGPCPNPTQR